VILLTQRATSTRPGDLRSVLNRPLIELTLGHGWRENPGEQLQRIKQIALMLDFALEGRERMGLAGLSRCPNHRKSVRKSGEDVERPIATLIRGPSIGKARWLRCG
jgi:hypothetical protein